MALIKCPECNTEISDKAESCPKCGCPIQKKEIGKPQKIVSYEYKHVKCGVDVVQSVIEQHRLFYWELKGTNTVVAKESHLERGGTVFDYDSIHSVVTDERFSTIDFQRSKNIPRLSEIKSVESHYFSIVAQLENLGCSSLDNYATPPPKKYLFSLLSIIFCWTVLLLALPFMLKENKDAYKKWQFLKREIDSLVENNRQLLNF